VLCQVTLPSALTNLVVGFCVCCTGSSPQTPTRASRSRNENVPLAQQGAWAHSTCIYVRVCVRACVYCAPLQNFNWRAFVLSMSKCCGLSKVSQKWSFDVHTTVKIQITIFVVVRYVVVVWCGAVRRVEP